MFAISAGLKKMFEHVKVKVTYDDLIFARHLQFTEMYNSSWSENIKHDSQTANILLLGDQVPNRTFFRTLLDLNAHKHSQI